MHSRAKEQTTCVRFIWVWDHPSICLWQLVESSQTLLSFDRLAVWRRYWDNDCRLHSNSSRIAIRDGSDGSLGVQICHHWQRSFLRIRWWRLWWNYILLLLLWYSSLLWNTLKSVCYIYRSLHFFQTIIWTTSPYRTCTCAIFLQLTNNPNLKYLKYAVLYWRLTPYALAEVHPLFWQAVKLEMNQSV